MSKSTKPAQTPDPETVDAAMAAAYVSSRLTRGEEPNLFIFKHDIKYLYEVPVEAGAQPEEEPAAKAKPSKAATEPRASDGDDDGEEYEEDEEAGDDDDEAGDEEEDAA